MPPGWDGRVKTVGRGAVEDAGGGGGHRKTQEDRGGVPLFTKEKSKRVAPGGIPYYRSSVTVKTGPSWVDIQLPCWISMSKSSCSLLQVFEAVFGHHNATA